MGNWLSYEQHETIVPHRVSQLHALLALLPVSPLKEKLLGSVLRFADYDLDKHKQITSVAVCMHETETELTLEQHLHLECVKSHDVKHDAKHETKDQYTHSKQSKEQKPWPDCVCRMRRIGLDYQQQYWLEQISKAFLQEAKRARDLQSDGMTLHNTVVATRDVAIDLCTTSSSPHSFEVRAL